ncbi:MAG: YbhB/YbcL family Raf kinase inhibitor-like protein [Candidatus Paceibacterota bacterium]
MSETRDLQENGLVLTSSAFKEGEAIPVVHSCDGDNISPPLAWSGVDKGAKSLVLTMEDPDAPGGIFDHWVVYDIPPNATEIPEGELPPGTPGVGTSGTVGYYGPCPPGERHYYVFTLYSLDTVLSFPEGASKEEVMEAMTGNVLQKAELTAYFER